MSMVREMVAEIAELLVREGSRTIAERDAKTAMLQGSPEIYQRVAQAIAVFVRPCPERAHLFLPVILRRIEKFPPGAR
jgi:hypothetical protein